MRRTMGTLVALTVIVGLAACSAPSDPVASTQASPTSTPSASGPCVADPAAVVARTPATTSTGEMPPDVAKTLDAAVTAALPESAAPGAVAAVRSPQGTWIKTYGVSNPTTESPMTADMYQRVGSVTKTFTGTLVLQLAEQGRLSLDDTVGKYIPGIPNGGQVTIRQLMNMTSGLASYTLDQHWQKVFFSDPYNVWTPDEVIAVSKGLEPLFPPGEKFNYSNTNTVLLGRIIETVTGKTYDQALQDGILTPLGLTHTSFPGESAAFPSPHAQGFTLQAENATPDKPVNATDWNPSWGWTAGEIISTIHDLLTYGRALGTGQGLLSDSMQEQRLSSFPSPRNQPSYGLALGCSAGWVGHTGELPGFNTTVYYDTDTDTTVVTMTNSDIPSGDCTDSTVLADGIWDKTTTGISCSAPAPRLFFAIADALGHPYPAPPQN